MLSGESVTIKDAKRGRDGRNHVYVPAIQCFLIISKTQSQAAEPILICGRQLESVQGLCVITATSAVTEAVIATTAITATKVPVTAATTRATNVQTPHRSPPVQSLLCLALHLPARLRAIEDKAYDTSLESSFNRLHGNFCMHGFRISSS